MDYVSTYALDLVLCISLADAAINPVVSSYKLLILSIVSLKHSLRDYNEFVVISFTLFNNIQ